MVRFLSAFWLIFSGPGQAVADSTGVRVLLFSGFAGVGVPSRDLAKDYGTYGEIGAGIWYKSGSDWLFGVDFSYLFGNGVKNDPVPNLRDKDGNIIGTNGSYATFKVFQRGYQFPLIKFGKVFSFKKIHQSNMLGGATLTGGAGWFQHWTYIQDLSKKTPQFSQDYLDGYDRLTGGPCYGIWLGYLYLPVSGKVNYHLELGYQMAQTKIQRYDFARNLPAGGQRTEALLQAGLRICFSVRSRPQDTYYYY